MPLEFAASEDVGAEAFCEHPAKSANTSAEQSVSTTETKNLLLYFMVVLS